MNLLADIFLKYMKNSFQYFGKYILKFMLAYKYIVG
jgi:hypothetical protein